MRNTLCIVVLYGVCANSFALSVPPSRGTQDELPGVPPAETRIQIIPTPPTPPRRHLESQELTQAMREELQRILWDSKLKYSALVLLTFVPNKLSTLAGKTLMAEGVKDVSVAVATALVNAVELDSVQRAKATARIAVLKGTGDWAGFVNGMVEITGKDAAILLATLPSTVADLLAGAGEAPLFLSAGVDASDQPLHPYIAPFLLRVGQELESECDYDAAREIYQEARLNLNVHLQRMVLNAGRNYAGLKGQPWPRDVVPESLPRHAYPYEYDELRYLKYGAAYIGAIKGYDQALVYLEESGKRLSALDALKDTHASERAEAADWLSRAEALLWACTPEEGEPLLSQIWNRCCSRSPWFGPAHPNSRGCWGWTAKEFNRVNGLYLEWQGHMASVKRQAELFRDDGFAALSACRMHDALSRLVDLEALMLKEPYCVKRTYDDLLAQIEKFQAEGLCQDRAAAAELVGPTGATAKVSAQVGVDCAARRKDYHARCKQMADQHVDKVCTPVYSGCALDVVGCLTALVEGALPDNYCSKPGYVGCATGQLEAYLGCLNTCNSSLLSGRINTFQLTDCRLKCQEAVDKGTQQCKAGAK